MGLYPIENHPGCHHCQQGIDGQLVAHGGVILQRLPEKIYRRPAPEQNVLPPFSFQHAPTHPQEPGPGQDAEWQAKPPDGQVLKGIKVGAPRPLQIPRQVGVGAGLEKLLMDFLDPFRVELYAEESRTAEGIGLENTESQQGNDRADNQEDNGFGNEIFHWRPVHLRHIWIRCLVGFSLVRLEITDHQGYRKYHRHGSRIYLGCNRHAEGNPKSNGPISERVFQKA